MDTLTMIRCDGSHPDLIENCRLLDIDLTERMGWENQKDYVQFNHVLDQIHHAVVAYLDGVPVGSGALKQYDETHVELKRVFVRPEYQRRGIGEQVVRELLSYARELGYPEMILESAVQLKEAHRLYYRLGFEKIDNFPPFAGMDQSLCMKKVLNKGE